MRFKYSEDSTPIDQEKKSVLALHEKVRIQVEEYLQYYKETKNNSVETLVDILIESMPKETFEKLREEISIRVI